MKLLHVHIYENFVMDGVVKCANVLGGCVVLVFVGPIVQVLFVSYFCVYISHVFSVDV